MIKFDYAKLYYVVTRENHQLTLELPDNFRFLGSFLLDNFSKIGEIEKLMQNINEIKKSQDIIISAEDLSEIEDMYSRVLKESFEKYLIWKEGHYILRENDFVLEKLKEDDNVELLSLLINKFPKYGKFSLYHSDNVFSMRINKEFGFLIRNINPAKTEKFPTIELHNLLNEMKQFILDYEDSKIPGLVPIFENS